MKMHTGYMRVWKRGKAGMQLLLFLSSFFKCYNFGNILFVKAKA